MSNGISGVGNKQLTTTQGLGLGNINGSSIARNAQLIETTMNMVEKALDVAGKALDVAGKALDQMAEASPTKPATTLAPGGCFPSEPPNPLDAVRDANSLKVDKDGKITTPGGYVIEQLGQFEWKVTGPDGKHTRVWGDPHVDEGDGGKWDFKRDTAFVLGDGTRINVTTKPWGNDMTVTGQLDIVSGDSHVRVTDIDKGKGKVGQPTNDGMAEVVRFHSNYKADIFQMGKETDDWTFEGKEIIGSEKGGEIIKTGNPVITDPRTSPFKYSPGADNPTKAGNGAKPLTWEMGKPVTDNKPAWAELNKLLDRLQDISKVFDQLKNTRSNGFNPFRRRDDLFGRYDRNEHRSRMTESFKAMGDMFRALEKLSRLNDMVRVRGPQMF